MKNTPYLFALLILVLNSGCENPAQNEFADLIIINAAIECVCDIQDTPNALAIEDGKILQIGTTEEIKKLAGEKTKVLDAKQNFLMPGFIEGHGHFSGLGKSLINLNFLNSPNWRTIVAQVEEKVKEAKPGEWIEGRGWHQEKWDEKIDKSINGYPFHDQLSEISPDNPVILFHASGHGLFANKKAMDMAGVNKETPNPVGGEIVKDIDGNPIGVFEERAMNSIRAAYNDYLSTLSKEQLDQKWLDGIVLAQKECLSKGITSFQDAGSSFEEIEKYTAMAANQELDLRLWAMLRHSYEDMKDNLDKFPIINAGDYFFTSRAIKTEVDGALGAFGAWLLKPYADKTNFHGQNTTSIKEVQRIAGLARSAEMQLCVHAIGDRANRVVLDLIESEYNKVENSKNLRWRIEHAQHLDPVDIPRFASLGVIASMQGIHCTSDAPFVVKRLGKERAKFGAYPWRSLIDAGAAIANGTDAPVEDVDPLKSFYASVTRKRADSGLEFFPEQRMTRKEAIHSYTLGNAYAAFEENEKGSIEVGKFADLVLLDKDLRTCSDEEILDCKVLMTMVDGEVKFEQSY